MGMRGAQPPGCVRFRGKRRRGEVSGAAKRDRSKYLRALARADNGDPGALNELMARAVLDNLLRFVVPAIAGPQRLVLLAALAGKDLRQEALRAAIERAGCGPKKVLMASGGVLVSGSRRTSRVVGGEGGDLPTSDMGRFSIIVWCSDRRNLSGSGGCCGRSGIPDYRHPPRWPV
jgi:hypothetical protein